MLNFQGVALKKMHDPLDLHTTKQKLIKCHFEKLKLRDHFRRKIVFQLTCFREDIYIYVYIYISFNWGVTIWTNVIHPKVELPTGSFWKSHRKKVAPLWGEKTKPVFQRMILNEYTQNKRHNMGIVGKTSSWWFFTNPFEKYALDSQIGTFFAGIGVNRNNPLKPPA